jgi:hypothetical protein
MKRLRKSRPIKDGSGSRQQQIQDAVETSLRRVKDEEEETDSSDFLTKEDFPSEEDDTDN